jgi:hypothetical protein
LHETFVGRRTGREAFIGRRSSAQKFNGLLKDVGGVQAEGQRRGRLRVAAAASAKEKLALQEEEEVVWRWQRGGRYDLTEVRFQTGR